MQGAVGKRFGCEPIGHELACARKREADESHGLLDRLEDTACDLKVAYVSDEEPCAPLLSPVERALAVEERGPALIERIPLPFILDYFFE